MTHKLFDKFTVDDKPIYLAEEDVEKIPYDMLADRANALNVIEARLYLIYDLMNQCRIILDDEQKEVKRVDFDAPLGCASFDVDKDYRMDKYALRSLMGIYWGAQRELDSLMGDLIRYTTDLSNETKHRDPRNISSTMEFHYIEGDYSLHNYARAKEGEE